MKYDTKIFEPIPGLKVEGVLQDKTDYYFVSLANSTKSFADYEGLYVPRNPAPLGSSGTGEAPDETVAILHELGHWTGLANGRNDKYSVNALEQMLGLANGKIAIEEIIATKIALKAIEYYSIDKDTSEFSDYIDNWTKPLNEEYGSEIWETIEEEANEGFEVLKAAVDRKEFIGLPDKETIEGNIRVAL
jgi:hypothetical protein